MVIRPILELFFKIILYMTFFSGVWLLTKPYLMPPFYMTARAPGIKAGYGSLNYSLLAVGARKLSFYNRLDLLLQSTWRFYNASSTVNFVIFSIALSLATLTINFSFTKSWPVTICASITALLLPYVALRLVLHLIRSNTSYELVPAVRLLLAAYRVNNKDTYFAILDTLKKLDSPLLKRSFIILASHIQNHRNKQDIETAVRLFVYKIQTSWAKQLGILFLNSLIDGRDIEHSLSNIVNDMKEGQKIIEQEKSNSHETILLGYFPILAFPLTLWFLSTISGQFNILHYQFKTPEGVASLITTFLFCLIGFILTLLMRKPKNDI